MKSDGSKVPIFDGDEANFPVWKMRFLAFAKLKKFKEALIEGGEVDLPSIEDYVIDLESDEGIRQHAAATRNDMAMACLTMAFTSESLIGMVYKAQDLTWPSGRAHLVMEALMEQYQPKDRISRVEMRTRLNGVKMTAGQNPKVMFEQLAAIENAYNGDQQQIDQDDMVAVVLGQAPKNYATVLTTEQRIRGDHLALKHLEAAMNAQWRISTAGADGDGGSNENELGLTSFTGTCYKYRKSVTGYSVFLEGAPVAMRSVGARVVALSVTEAELYAATMCAQEMMYVTRVMESIGLTVKKPMKLEIDNQGAVDLINNWSVGGRTKHIEVRQYFLRELKESGIIVTKWTPGANNESDLFTKNLPRAVFEKHAKMFVSDD